jgi:hypothetical protein
MVHVPLGLRSQKRNCALEHPVAVAVYVMAAPAACGEAVAVVSAAAVHGGASSV